MTKKINGATKIIRTININRANRAKKALKAYMSVKGSDDCKLTAASDLFTDMLHLFRLQGQEPTQMIARSLGHFEAEESR